MEWMTIGCDLLLSKRIENKIVRSTLSRIFQINEKFVYIQNFSNIEVIIPKNIKIYCLSNPIEGDFKELISIFIKTQDLKFDPIDLAEKMANFLNISCLISDDEYDPYTMLLIESNSNKKKITLKPYDLDDAIYSIQ